MEPDLFAAFVEAFTAEWNRLQAAASGEHEAQRAELERVHQQIVRLVDAISEGTPGAAVRERLASLEERRLALESSLTGTATPAPRLHPKLAAVYRSRVAELAQALETDDPGALTGA